VTTFSRGVDSIVTSTLYPAICAVRDRVDLLFEAFVKSNRLALMWGMPFGVGVALFASDLVHFIFGNRWKHAIPVIAAFGIVAALDQLGFNWTAFLRALNRTRPIAILAGLDLLSFAVITAPLLIAFGLKGFAAGWVAAQMVSLAGRTYYLAQLFSGFRMLKHVVRSVAPIIAPVAVVLVARTLEGGSRHLAFAIGELVVYLGLTLIATILLERRLLQEVFGYLRRRRAPQPQVAGAT
jgi:O-antigen/teichoic acid export membrane protein